jgi:hypothetical protein
MKEISLLKEGLDGIRNNLSLLFLVVEHFFRLKVIELNCDSGFALDYPAKRGSVGKYLESS